MSDLGGDAGQAVLNMTSKGVDMGVRLITSLLQKLFPSYNERIAKENYKKAKLQDKITKTGGYVSLKKLKESGFPLTFAKVEMTKEQLIAFENLAYKRGVPISYISNGRNENGVKTYLAVFKTMDENRIKDITEQLVRNIKLESIENEMNEVVHYKKKSFDSALRAVDGKIIDRNNPIIICDKNNPSNYIKVVGTQEEYEDGKPYVASLYEVYNNGKKQRSNEFKHGEFLHNCDGDGKNSSEAGEEHWNNMKAEMKEKVGFGDDEDVLVFASMQDYKNYVEMLEYDKEQIVKDEEYYDELENEKGNLIKEDIDSFNEKQTQGLFAEISGVAKGEAMTFADTVDHFQVGEWEKEEPYYICKRTDPDNYIEVVADMKIDGDGNKYNEHTYNIFVDDVQVKNPYREDGRFVDERFDGRPVDYWKKMKESMKEAGDFTDDCVVFNNLEDYLKYRQLYQQEQINLKVNSTVFEVGEDGLRKDYSYIQQNLENCKKELLDYEDVGTLDEEGLFIVDSSAKDVVRVGEAQILSKQIENYQDMVNTANNYYMNKNNAEMVAELTEKLKGLQTTEEKLYEQRQKMGGVKSEMKLRKSITNSEIGDKKIFSQNELKEFANNFKESRALKDIKAVEKSFAKNKVSIEK